MASLLSYPILQRRGTVCGTVVVLAALADYLFYEHAMGWTLGLFGAMVLACLLMRAGGVLWRSWQGVIAVLASFGVMGALVEEPSVVGVLLGLMGIGVVALLTRQKLATHVMGWVGQFAFLGLMLFVRPVADWAVARRWEKRQRHAPRRRLARLAITIAWWFFPILAGMVFFLLFALANPIIESWLHTVVVKLLTVFDWLPEYLGPGRILLWVMVGLMSYGLLRYRRGYGVRGRVAVPPVVRAVPRETWVNGPQMIVRCLVVFNAVFGLETVLDVIYLFGGKKLPAGMDYRDYAHRGAYPLVFTALVAGMFVLWAFRIGGPAHRSAWSRRLVYLWLAQNVFLLVSTYWRLWLYVEACLLTRLRVAALIWVGLVALGFVWIVVKIAASRSNAWLWVANALTTAAVLYACAFVDFDGGIAEYNVTHCAAYTHREGGPQIELPYLAGLGPEVLPALVRLRGEDKADREYLDGAIGELERELTGELSDWRGGSLRRWRIQGSRRWVK